MRNVEVRSPIFRVRIVAILGLSRIDHKILAVTRVIERARPNKIQDRVDPVPTIHAQARLQRVVVGLPQRVLLEDIKSATGTTERPRRTEENGCGAGSGAAVRPWRCPERTRTLSIVDRLCVRLVDVKESE